MPKLVRKSLVGQDTDFPMLFLYVREDDGRLRTDVSYPGSHWNVTPDMCSEEVVRTWRSWAKAMLEI